MFTGRSQRETIAETRDRPAGRARQDYNRLQARNSRRVRALPDRSGQLEEDAVTHSWMKSKLDSRAKNKQIKVAYAQVKNMTERKLAHQKRGVLSNQEYRNMAQELRDNRDEKALDSVIIERGIRRFTERMEKYDTEPVSSMTENRMDGTVSFMFVS